MKYLLWLILYNLLSITSSKSENVSTSDTLQDLSTYFPTTDDTITVNTKTSRKPHVLERIVRGYNCPKKHYKYLVTILSGYNVYCGGSLLTRKAVLTAAHCCEKMYDFSRYSVHVAQRYYASWTDYALGIRNVFIHPDYSLSPLRSDICIISLDSNVSYPDATYVKLASPEEYQTLLNKGKCNKAIVMGFGDQHVKPVHFRKRSNDFNRLTARKYKTHVQCIELSVLPYESCKDIYWYMITDTMFCGIDPKRAGADACQGDSGGPVICDDMQIGLVSAGLGCGQPQYPGLYCRVDSHIDFILDAQERANLGISITYNFNIIRYLVFYIYILYSCSALI